MCGIAGIFRLHTPRDDRDVVTSMLEILRRRGPDDQGIEHDGPLTVGHRRLSILDLSASGRQPMRAPGGSLLVSFNGEIYNFEEIRGALGLRAEEMRTRTDTEVLLRAWERWGSACLDRLVGQFAFALYDSGERRLHLARDRFGEKPLFYHLDGDALAFASAIPALLRAPWVPRELDSEAMLEYLALRYVISPRTVLAGVKKLPPGHLLTAGSDGVTVQKWYEPRVGEGRVGGSERSRRDLVEEFGSLLAQASRRCLVSDVPVALLLSDGIDSNAIRASLAECGADVASFTYGPVFDREAASPRLKAEAGGASSSWDLRVSAEERLTALRPVLASLGEPVGDGAALATWFLIRAARPRATVFLSGHGGDEVLGGYRLSQDRFRLAAMKRFAWLPAGWIGPALERYTFGEESVLLRRAALRRAPVRFAPAVARYLIHRPLPAGEVRGMLGGAGASARARYLGGIDDLYAECPDGAAGLDRIQSVLLRTFLSENVLSFADAVAMDSSAELRMPFLDRDLVAFVLGLPPALRVARLPGRANTKRILRLWGERHLPRDVSRVRKKSFSYGTIRNLLKLDAPALRSMILDAAPLRRALPGLEAWVRKPADTFHGPWEGTLWALLTLGVWSDAAGVR